MLISLSKLKSHPKNSEIYSLSNIEDLENSISSLGLLERLVIDDEFQVISGNRRLVAIQNLGWKKVDCEKVSLPEDEVLTYLIHHNKQRIKTCREQLNEIGVLMDQYKIGQGKRTDISTSDNPHRSSRTRDVVGEIIGISGYQIAKLLLIDKENEELIDLIDKGILTINQAYIQTTRIKKERESRLEIRKNNVSPNDSSFRFFNKSSDNMTEMHDEEVQLIFTSPPYWNKRKYTENGGLGNEKHPNDYVNNLVSHLTDCKRVLNKKGSFFLNLGDTFNDGNLMNIPHRVIIGLQDEGWILRNSIIWAKTNPKPSSSKSNLCPTYEFIFHLVKSSDYIYNPTLAPIKDSTKPSHSPRHRNLKNDQIKINPYIPRDGKNMGDWWSEEIVQSAVVNQKLTEGVEHPAPFPEKIVILPVLQTTNEGDLVLDPFCGSMTTGKVSERFNRQFVGYDTQIY